MAQKISPNLPKLHRDLCFLLNEISLLNGDFEKVEDLKSQSNEILKGTSVLKYNETYLKNAKTLTEVVAACEVLVKLDSKKEEVKKLILESDGSQCKLNVKFQLSFNFFRIGEMLLNS
jgi:hypothetical protein